MVAPPGDDFDRQLQKLAIEAQQHPPQSSQRLQTLNKLINEIWQSNQLGHPQSGLWLPDVYEDLYNEARQRTMLEICQNIDKYKPQYPVMAWVNSLLRYQFIAVVNDYNNNRIISLPSLDDLERFASQEDTLDDAILVRRFLQDDPENLLQAESIRGRPDVTFQILAWARFVEDYSWDELSKNLGISPQTLCSFFNRNLRNLMPYFNRYLQE
ncbi:hypothetical protein [Argonema antarcticum]|uniref:hypothetical protein n=1 Tax=Argonema antarcticum TaxID=2942763 RepID=UPI0020139BF3|nr:hypothetical protein [Argonema antarcticum]MCL1473357.1 hypothetical protein [Argonema antarcticum A004/B2]